jgi:hypothetical protein
VFSLKHISNKKRWMLGALIAMSASWSSSTNVRGIDAAFNPTIWSQSFQNDDNRTVNLGLSIIWNGHEITDHNIIALKKFRESFKDLQVMHFISPSYFTRGTDIAANNLQMMKPIIKDGDRIGLLLSGWRSYVLEAGVIFRNGPSFWGSSNGSRQCARDCGSDVPMHIYPSQDLDSIIGTGISVLTAQGFAKPIAIKTEGFVSNQLVMESAANQGIFMDFSAVSPKTVFRKLGNYPLYSWIEHIWKNIEVNTTPFVKSVANNAMTVVPQSLGAIDYHSPNSVSAIFKSYLNSISEDNSPSSRPNNTFTLTIYQSTAKRNITNITSSIQSIFEISGQKQINLRSLELPGQTYVNTLAVESPEFEEEDESNDLEQDPSTIFDDLEEKLEIRTH